MRSFVANFCSDGKQYFAGPDQYPAQVANDSSRTLADNVRRLMEAAGDTQAKVAKRAGLAQRSVGNVVTYGTTHETSPTLRTVDGIADAYGVPVWMLLLDQVPLEVLQSPELARLIDNYIRAPASARANIDRVADAEVRYAEIPGVPSRKTG
ncbi:helix-turn-helix transcriptional regulator [Stenotrophomonas muris]|uniref:helix-turn-helix domain-containing protein n=1 Tax=Stenotrophomonas muris TaxID=2963283 RepID=UPI00300EC79F